jgi:hypothetical protein
MSAGRTGERGQTRAGRQAIAAGGRWRPDRAGKGVLMPLPAGGAAKRPTIAALTGLRFLIALSVVLHHVRFGDLMPWPAILEPLIAHRLGVSSFSS